MKSETDGWSVPTPYKIFPLIDNNSTSKTKKLTKHTKIFFFTPKVQVLTTYWDYPPLQA